ncbi:hypothetical protein P22_0953 [Propionispora sp. 2/2-37]|uniref:hypothetical protein n=1 Tax=Propionispora sp. 2/2-37 TaxID=1677858 RepID=UPI0006BB609B|nr:hypothetical protein [Propionispora sp. 2/2-37]CUH94887.1 hypothetical protein P22_0953 [Propionispora sp. 2/2-37]
MKEKNAADCSTAGQGFARTEDTNIASESCGLPPRGFGFIDFGNSKPEQACCQGCTSTDCSTAGMGFARTEKTPIAPDNCANPSRGFATVDYGK